MNPPACLPPLIVGGQGRGPNDLRDTARALAAIAVVALFYAGIMLYAYFGLS